MINVEKALRENQGRIKIETYLTKLRKQDERFQSLLETKVYWMDGGRLKDQL